MGADIFVQVRTFRVCYLFKTKIARVTLHRVFLVYYSSVVLALHCVRWRKCIFEVSSNWLKYIPYWNTQEMWILVSKLNKLDNTAFNMSNQIMIVINTRTLLCCDFCKNNNSNTYNIMQYSKLIKHFCTKEKIKIWTGEGKNT